MIRNKNRISLIQNSKEDSLKIDKIREVPKILYFDELSSAKEEKKYVNDQLEKYFNKKSIVVK
jgi:ABC-type iron transport system FetAB ATPase subunit